MGFPSFYHFYDDHWSFRWPLGHLDDHFTTQKTRVPLRKGSATAARFRQLGIMAPQSWLKCLMTCYAFKVDNLILQYKQNIIYIYIYNIISSGLCIYMFLGHNSVTSALRKPEFRRSIGGVAWLYLLLNWWNSFGWKMWSKLGARHFSQMDGSAVNFITTLRRDRAL